VSASRTYHWLCSGSGWIAMAGTETFDDLVLYAKNNVTLSIFESQRELSAGVCEALRH
jgi:hypothetical protein